MTSMTDSYVAFANSVLGSRLVSTLGLPRPVPLERFESHLPVIQGEVLVGAAPGGHLIPPLVQAFRAMEVATVAWDVPNWTALCNQAGMMSGRWGVEDAAGAPVKALVYDATGLQSVEQADHLYRFLHATVRSVQPCGRVLILGRSPSSCSDASHASVQRALEGLMRSLAKEIKRGIAVQLLQVHPGADVHLPGCLRFFLSPRSAYVSGQVVSVQDLVSPVLSNASVSIDWTQPLQGKTVMVTGASRGIGASIAEVLARDGAQVVCVDVPAAHEALEAMATRVRGVALPLDITATDASSLLVEQALAQGGWDGVVHNAGITRDKTIAKMPEHLWQSVQQVNLMAPASITQALLHSNALRPQARVVCVSSIAGLAGNVGQTNYAFSKAGVVGLVQGLTPLLATHGMAINAVAPGFIETQMTAAIPLAIREAGRRMNAMGQGGQPVDVAETIAWLLSTAASGVHGQVIRVCGQSWLGA